MSSEQILQQKQETKAISPTENAAKSINSNISNQLLINKAFFGKDNCLKITLNYKGECYMHFGMADKKSNSWVWKKIKFNDSELGSILLVLAGKQKSVSFFHSYNNANTQIWVNRDKDYVFLKVKEMSKSISIGEQEVVRVLLEHIILRTNLKI